VYVQERTHVFIYFKYSNKESTCPMRMRSSQGWIYPLKTLLLTNIITLVLLLLKMRMFKFFSHNQTLCKNILIVIWKYSFFIQVCWVNFEISSGFLNIKRAKKVNLYWWWQKGSLHLQTNYYIKFYKCQVSLNSVYVSCVLFWWICLLFVKL